MDEPLRIEIGTTTWIASDMKAIASLHGKMAAVMGGIREIDKDAYHEYSKYNYSSYSNVAEHLRRIMSAQGLALYVSAESLSQTTTDKGHVRTNLRLQITIADSGSGAMRVGSWDGEAVDSGTADKGIYKAYTLAIKYFLMRTFLVSSEDDDRDEEDLHGQSTGKRGTLPRKPESQQQSTPSEPHWSTSPEKRKVVIDAAVRRHETLALTADEVETLMPEVSEWTQYPASRDWFSDLEKRLAQVAIPGPENTEEA